VIPDPIANMPCPACGCQAGDAAAAHAIAGALLIDDIDAALEAGLLHAAPCMQCEAGCTQRWLAARTDRERALAARERYRARQMRLEARAAERARARAVPAAPAKDVPAPALPSAAAAALARAKARAAQRHKP
jgi:hypothetical protein